MSLIRGDALRLPLRPGSVDLVVTSPPYWALRSYTDGGAHYAGQIGSEDTPGQFVDALVAVTAQLVEALAPGGSIFVNLGDKYAGSGAPGTTGVIGSKQPKRTGLSSYSKSTVGLGDGEKFATGARDGNRRSRPAKVEGIRPKSLMGLPWRYALRCVDELGLILRAEIVWDKPNALPESVDDRVRRSHEQWFHLTKEPRYFAAVDEIREPSSGYHRGPGIKIPEIPGQKIRGMLHTSNPLGKLPGSVWTIPSEPLKVPDHLGVDHFAAFPQEWPRRFILGWSPPGICTKCGEGRRPVVDIEHEQYREAGSTGRPKSQDLTGTRSNGRNGTGYPQTTTSATITGYECGCPDDSAPTRPAVVLDPFGGTGTTAMVARALGRTGVSLDLSADYLRLARWRIHESGHASKTVERTNRERQGSLL